MKKDYIRVVVRGVILVDAHILIARSKDATNTFLPGRHVEFGENLPAALIRELFEEVGLCIQVSDYLGMVEHKWVESVHEVSLKENRHRHQINHVFAAVLPRVHTLPTLESREDHLEFFWVLLSELSEHNLMPPPLIKLVEHFMKGDRAYFGILLSQPKFSPKPR